MDNFQYQMLIKVESPGARGERIINYNKSKIWKMSIPCITNSIHTLKLNSIQLKEQKKNKKKGPAEPFLFTKEFPAIHTTPDCVIT